MAALLLVGQLFRTPPAAVVWILPVELFADVSVDDRLPRREEKCPTLFLSVLVLPSNEPTRFPDGLLLEFGLLGLRKATPVRFDFGEARILRRERRRRRAGDLFLHLR